MIPASQFIVQMDGQRRVVDVVVLWTLVAEQKVVLGVAALAATAVVAAAAAAAAAATAGNTGRKRLRLSLLLLLLLLPMLLLLLHLLLSAAVDVYYCVVCVEQIVVAGTGRCDGVLSFDSFAYYAHLVWTLGQMVLVERKRELVETLSMLFVRTRKPKN